MGFLDCVNFFMFFGASLLFWNPTWKFNVWLRIINALAIIFTIEVLLKIYAYSPKKYWTKFWTAFIGFVTLLSAISQILYLAIPSSKTEAVRVFKGIFFFSFFYFLYFYYF